MPNPVSMSISSLNSLSSALVLGVTLCRNKPGISNKCLAQVGYALAATTATIESIAAIIFCVGSLALYPVSAVPLKHSVNWLDSSSFSVVWAVTDFLLNPFVLKLVANESSARQIVSSGNLMKIPRNAII
ncbi:Conserved hypothetical protein [Candidatus Protochlamydia naegleriophila]|uniref:Uncharacterized protein n=1 Tax=Candidatus Protochlamydia naegleriophila TaxID=389348 RepID=A0A0U5JC36_9BACT|nr:hypothetical protein [Candidatus Protochlamydia naegleriophila]CUI17432.1 Conserved hypothetical protein [Candidatus Protochlamydia naegleriophila]